MRTLFAKILLWLLATIVITACGFMLIDAFSSPPSGPRRGTQFFLQEARHIYSREGVSGVAEYVQRLNTAFGGSAFLVNPAGRDVVSRVDRSDLALKAKNSRFPVVFQNFSAFFYTTDDEGYGFFLQPETMSSVWIQRLWLLAAILALSYILARHLTAPLRRLQHSVERFGAGDFTARSRSERRDEFGQLARTFDQMAERIEHLVESQRDLLRDISHELRSPLTRLGLAVELARSRSDKEKAFNTIEREVERLNVLVGEVLSLARTENQKSIAQHTSIRVDEILEDLIEACSVEAANRHCRLVYSHRHPITIDANEELVRRAIDNVLRNAVRYAPENSDVTVSVNEYDSTWELSDSPPWLRRGGRDTNKNVAKPPLQERTGWLAQLPINRRIERTTPSAPAKEASRHLITGAATPPLPRRGMPVPETMQPNCLTIRIRDAGPGVPPESLTRIFEPFYRVDHDRNRETGGNGLGLAIALRAVEAHGGTIVARNANPGLEVEIQLPVAVSACV
jgi:two-component system sensor histidine kinase CpxA